jgi:hypothetical protein
MGEMNPDFMAKKIKEHLLKQAAEEGVLTCLTCESKLDVDALWCGVCGWINPLKEEEALNQLEKNKNIKGLNNVGFQTLNEGEIVEGHGKIDVTCECGSRFVWWYDGGNRWNYPLGRWMIVGEKASECECGEPPMPFKTGAEVKAYLAKNKNVLRTIE